MTDRLNSLTNTPRHGAVSVEEEEKVREKSQSAAFIGSGFKLGDSEGPSVQITGRQKEESSTKVFECVLLIVVGLFP